MSWDSDMPRAKAPSEEAVTPTSYARPEPLTPSTVPVPLVSLKSETSTLATASLKVTRKVRSVRAVSWPAGSCRTIEIRVGAVVLMTVTVTVLLLPAP